MLKVLRGNNVTNSLNIEMNSETPVSIIDRISINAFKIYHLDEEIQREEVTDEHRNKCAVKLSVLEEQHKDLEQFLTKLLADLSSKVDLHFGNDNNPRHFAVAGVTPTLTIFGRPWAANWTPPQAAQHCALEHDPGCKNKCTYPRCKLECLNGVTVETVQTELDKMIKTFC